MLFELNEVLLQGEPRTLSMMAKEGQLTCLTGDDPARLTRWLLAMLGFVPVVHGFICIDGEPLTVATAPVFRGLMAYAPSRLKAGGEVKTYEPPSVQDVFNLKANRERPISNGILSEEMRRVGASVGKEQAQLLAVAGLLGKPILLADNPPVEALAYLQRLLQQGTIVIATSKDGRLLAEASQVVEV
ncbi:MAG: hypothetical protein IJ841_10540 [Prevotella sp.]|nr:hypothetical protein [Prevotella sp.]